MCLMEAFVAMNEDVLTRVFQHLSVEELIHSAVLVCRQWRDVVLFGQHRRMPTAFFQILTHGASAQNSPLRRYHAIVECHLLCDFNAEDRPLQRKLFKDWWMTKAGNWNLSAFIEEDAAGLLPEACTKVT